MERERNYIPEAVIILAFFNIYYHVVAARAQYLYPRIVWNELFRIANVKGS